MFNKIITGIVLMVSLGLPIMAHPRHQNDTAVIVQGVIGLTQVLTQPRQVIVPVLVQPQYPAYQSHGCRRFYPVYSSYPGSQPYSTVIYPQSDPLYNPEYRYQRPQQQPIFRNIPGTPYYEMVNP